MRWGARAKGGSQSRGVGHGNKQKHMQGTCQLEGTGSMTASKDHKLTLAWPELSL